MTSIVIYYSDAVYAVIAVQVYAGACKVLAQIHSVDISKAGLDDFGKKTDYMKRNLARWVVLVIPVVFTMT